MSPARNSRPAKKSKKAKAKPARKVVKAAEPNAQLAECVRTSTQQYLDDMGSTPPTNLHKLILSEAERVLIETVLARTEGNQSRTADMLGITRATLRSRLQRYGLAGD